MKKNISLKITCLALLSTAGSLFAQIPSNGLVAYFPFTGNANDLSGSNITGTPTSGGYPANTPPVLTADRKAAANSAYDFVPAVYSTSFINLGQPTQFNFGTTSSFSISLWMKFTVYQVSATMFANEAWHLGIRNLGGKDHLNFVFRAASFNSDSIMAPGAWIHVAGVFNRAAKTMELYLNGTRASGFSYSGGPFGPSVPSLNTDTMTLDGTPTGTTQIGLVGGTIPTNFKGAMDDILIYNRALSASEMSAIYTATGGPRIETANHESRFTVGPNPTNGAFLVQFSDALLKGSSLKAYAIDGRLVMEGKNKSGNMTMDLGQFGEGCYLLRMEAPAGVYTRKVSVVK